MPDCPNTPQSERPEDRGFTRQAMVGWFDPTQLARTGIKSVLSAVCGSYADKREMHSNEVFSAQRIEGDKSFLRMRIDEHGALTIFPLGVRRVGQRWRLNPKAKNGEPWFDLIGTAATPHLIEDPIVIGAPRAAGAARGAG